jgi:hypothetical protein
MKADDFASVPEELIGHVLHYASFLEKRAIALEVEPFDVAYPRVPHLRGVRGTTTTFFEIAAKIDVTLAAEWAKFGHMADTDTRFVIAIPGDFGSPPPEEIAALTDLGIGLDMVLPSKVVTLTPAHDLAIGIEVPALPDQLVAPLAEAYELFEQGYWKKGFEDACIVLQREARDLLLSILPLSRVSFQDQNGNPIAHTSEKVGERRVERMTLGQLGLAYKQLVSPNQQESRVGECLVRVNDDRVTVAHFADDSPERAAALRRRVGKNVMTVVNGLKFIRGL